MSEPYIAPNELPTLREIEAMRRDLSEAHAMNRGLLRQLKKAQEAALEAQRAHAKMVATLTETMRENTVLTTERDMWKAKALRYEMPADDFGERRSGPIDMRGLAHNLSDDEINAIRKAMARLHHPDVGGDPERMKQWNSALDRISRT